MSKLQLQTSTVEENFMFGSPPLYSGFPLNTCCSQDAVYKTSHDCGTYNIDCYECSMSDENLNLDNMSNSTGAVKLNGYSRYSNLNGFGRSYSSFAATRNGNRSNEQMIENLNQLSLNKRSTNHLENRNRILELAGIRVQHLSNNKPVFKKRKDLRALKSVLSSDRFREVVMKFGDGGDDKEILDSVHKTMKGSNKANVTCLFCLNESQVYENFPVVDGTLFLSPLLLSRTSIDFADDNPERQTRYMSYICVNCMEGKSLHCINCKTHWNGSFFQIGTLYSYNILSATPCCETQVSCKKCTKPVINIKNGEASTLYFSHFSKKVVCPHCYTEDFHFVKPISSLTIDESSA